MKRNTTKHRMSSENTNEKTKLYESVITNFFNILVPYLNLEKFYDDHEILFDDICASVNEFKSKPNYPNSLFVEGGKYYSRYITPQHIIDKMDSFEHMIYLFCSKFSVHMGLEPIHDVTETILFDIFFYEDVINYIKTHDKYLFSQAIGSQNREPWCYKCKNYININIDTNNTKDPRMKCFCLSEPWYANKRQKTMLLPNFKIFEKLCEYD